MDKDKVDILDYEEYKKYLKSEINIYVWYRKTTKIKIDLKESEKVKRIEESFDKLIYFWEYNPVENIRQRKSKKEIKRQIDDNLKKTIDK